jgi:hypothetical protein
MRIWVRQSVVIALSLTVLCSSIAGAYAVWTVFSPLGMLKRGLLSIFGWIVAFAVSTILFWKITNRLFPT